MVSFLINLLIKRVLFKLFNQSRSGQDEIWQNFTNQVRNDVKVFSIQAFNYPEIPAEGHVTLRIHDIFHVALMRLTFRLINGEMMKHV